MRQQGLHQLVADGIERIEGSHRLLEDHGDIPAADAPQLILGQAHQFPPLERIEPEG